MNLIYQDEELKEALETTNELIANVRERKDSLFKELSENLTSVAVSQD